jgi:hypothetical protein
VDEDVSYLTYEDFLRAAAQALGMDVNTVRRIANRPLVRLRLGPPSLWARQMVPAAS